MELQGSHLAREVLPHAFAALGKTLRISVPRLALLPPEGRPTSTTLVVVGLADPDLLVEVEAIAVIGE